MIIQAGVDPMTLQFLFQILDLWAEEDSLFGWPTIISIQRSFYNQERGIKSCQFVAFVLKDIIT